MYLLKRHPLRSLFLFTLLFAILLFWQRVPQERIKRLESVAKEAEEKKRFLSAKSAYEKIERELSDKDFEQLAQTYYNQATLLVKEADRWEKNRQSYLREALALYERALVLEPDLLLAAKNRELLLNKLRPAEDDSESLKEILEEQKELQEKTSQQSKKESQEESKQGESDQKRDEDSQEGDKELEKLGKEQSTLAQKRKEWEEQKNPKPNKKVSEAMQRAAEALERGDSQEAAREQNEALTLLGGELGQQEEQEEGEPSQDSPEERREREEKESLKELIDQLETQTVVQGVEETREVKQAPKDW